MSFDVHVRLQFVFDMAFAVSVANDMKDRDANSLTASELYEIQKRAGNVADATAMAFRVNRGVR